MKHSYLLVGIKINKLIAMLKRNGGFSIKYSKRVFILFASSLWASFFTLLEHLYYDKKIRSITKLNCPIFVVGNWRTGTTFLHQLLALDPQFNYMDVFNVSHPDHFLVSKKYYAAMMTKMMNDTRPMDNVKVGVNEPQEDEYALIKMNDEMVLEKLVFQKGNNFFIEETDDFMPKEKESFSESIKLLMRKLQVTSDKTPIFKNPFHSLRIPFLRQYFPNAKYIHIYRNPIDVVPSSIHMWNIVGRQNILKGKWIEPNVEVIAKLYNRIILGIRREFKNMNDNSYVEITFENLEKNPIATIKTIYQKLELTFSSDYEKSLLRYCNDLKSYKKNSYTISESDKNLIKNIMFETTPEYF